MGCGAFFDQASAKTCLTFRVLMWHIKILSVELLTRQRSTSTATTLLCHGQVIRYIHRVLVLLFQTVLSGRCHHLFVWTWMPILATIATIPRKTFSWHAITPIPTGQACCSWAIELLLNKTRRWIDSHVVVLWWHVLRLVFVERGVETLKPFDVTNTVLVLDLLKNFITHLYLLNACIVYKTLWVIWNTIL